MIRIDSEHELLMAFREIDRDEVDLASAVKFPLILKDYLAWTEPSGHRVYLLFQDPNGNIARGLVFRRSSIPAQPIVQMCQWCHSVRGGNAVRLLTVKASQNRTLGLHLCSDLSCKEKVLSTPGVNDMREPYSRYEKLYRVIMNMSDFMRLELGARSINRLSLSRH